MVEGKLFEGIYSEKDGIKRNVGFVKACKIDGSWYIKVDIKGLYDVRDWVDVNYLVATDKKDYSFELGKMEIVRGIGSAEFVINPGGFLPEYGFEQAVGVTFGDCRESCVKAYWGTSDNHGIEPFANKIEPKPVLAAAQIEQDMQDVKPQPVLRQQISESKKQEENVSKPDIKFIQDIFNDDEYVDCMEITPQQFKDFAGLDDNLANNSFLLHAFYKYHHILIARPNDERKANMIFVGAPGVYSNRERYLACLFGLRNFKKSHRSDYTNPNFGYWYAEINI